MAYTKILPSTVLLFIDVLGGTAYDLLGCLTSITHTMNNAEIDAATMCGPDKLPGEQSFGLSADGQLIEFAVTDPNMIGHFEMIQATLNKTLVGFKIGPAVPTTGQIVTEGVAYISGYDNNYDSTNPATFSLTFAISGTPTYTKTV